MSTQEAQSGKKTPDVRTHCGHEAVTADGAPLHCYLPVGHAGYHEETFRLRDGTLMRTNWGSDGLGMHATKDRP